MGWSCGPKELWAPGDVGPGTGSPHLTTFELTLREAVA